MTDSTNKIAVPIWYWVVAGLATLWNLFGGFDLVNSLSLNQDYLASYGPEMMEFLTNMPMWAKGAWSIAILTAILGSISLLLRRAWAYPLYIIAVVAMIISFTYQWTAEVRPQVEGGTIMTVVVFAVAFFLLWFARTSKGKGWIS